MMTSRRVGVRGAMLGRVHAYRARLRPPLAVLRLVEVIERLQPLEVRVLL